MKTISAEPMLACMCESTNPGSIILPLRLTTLVFLPM